MQPNPEANLFTSELLACFSALGFGALLRVLHRGLAGLAEERDNLSGRRIGKDGGLTITDLPNHCNGSNSSGHMLLPPYGVRRLAAALFTLRCEV